MQIPLWILVGLAAAVFIGGQTAYQKYALASMDSIQVAFYTNLFAIPPLLAFALYSGITFDTDVLLPLGLSITVNIAGAVLIVTALNYDDVGVIGSFRSFVPIGVAVIEPLVFAGEMYVLLTFAASVTAMAGTYVLLVEDSYTAPLRRISETGPQLALISAAGYSAAFVFDRVALSTSSVSPSVYPVFLTCGVAAGLGIYLTWRDGLENIITITRTGVFLGTLRAGVLVFAILNLTLTTAANASIIVQFGNLVALGLGYVFFDEEYIGWRLAGGLILMLSVGLAVL